jgi:drug/metabolite transporter (DMT)-like permease
MLTASILGVEPLSARKSLGVLIAMAGVALALLLNLIEAPDGAWRGDLLMVGAAFCMALYNVWSKPFIRRSSPIAFTTMGMAVGAVCLGAFSAASGGLVAAARFDLQQWFAVLYLGVFGAAIAFWLWALALRHTTPTRVAISVTVNPIAASIVGALLLGEPFHWNLGMGLVMVLAGIGIAITGGSRDSVPPLPSSATQPASMRP